MRLLVFLLSSGDARPPNVLLDGCVSAIRAYYGLLFSLERGCRSEIGAYYGLLFSLERGAARRSAPTTVYSSSMSCKPLSLMVMRRCL